MLKVTANGKVLNHGPERDFYLSVAVYGLLRVGGGLALIGTIVYFWLRS